MRSHFSIREKDRSLHRGHIFGALFLTPARFTKFCGFVSKLDCGASAELMETITEQMDAGKVGSISDIPERKHQRRACY